MRTDPNTIPDEVADAAQTEYHEFVFGQGAETLTRGRLGVSRQAWKCAIAAALDALDALDPRTSMQHSSNEGNTSNAKRD